MNQHASVIIVAAGVQLQAVISLFSTNFCPFAHHESIKESGSMATFIPNLDSRWISGQIHSPSSLPQAEYSRYPLNGRLGGPQSRSELREEETFFFLLLGSKSCSSVA